MNYCAKPTFKGCRIEIELSTSMKYMKLKVDHNLSEAALDAICSITRRLLDSENKVHASFKETHKLLSGLSMGVIRLEVCICGYIFSTRKTNP